MFISVVIAIVNTIECLEDLIILGMTSLIVCVDGGFVSL